MTDYPLHSGPSDEALLSHILSALDIAVFERSTNSGTFHLRGLAPEWWPLPREDDPCTALDLEQWSPFLRDYLATNDAAYKAEQGPFRKSGPWTEPDRQGGTMTLEATVLSLESKTVLLMERLGAGFEQM